MVKDRIVVLGAGLAGLSAAWHLQNKGIECLVFEKEPDVGGLCRSRRIKGFTFDCDGHLLHFKNKYTMQMVKRLLKGELLPHERNAWIHSFGMLGRYPFQANLCFLPRGIARECLIEFLKARQSDQGEPPVNFLKWIKSSFGKGIARHFMIPYNSKFWTVPLEDMTSAWTGNFIPQPKPSEIVKGFFSENRHRFGYNSTFWYPRQAGIGQLAQAFGRQLRNISRDSPVTRIDLEKKEITVDRRGTFGFDALISTIPLPELAKIIHPMPAGTRRMFGRLRWNSIFNLNLGMKGACQPGRHWIYFPHKEYIFFRVGFFHNFSAGTAPAGNSAIYTEVAYSKERPVDKSSLVQRIIKDLSACGIISKNNKLAVLDINDIKYGYPIYDKNYSHATGAIKRFLSRNQITVCGRYGSWQYMSMEDAIIDGKNAAARFKR
jgi:protoporphyrinogen oxidase